MAGTTARWHHLSDSPQGAWPFAWTGWLRLATTSPRQPRRGPEGSWDSLGGHPGDHGSSTARSDGEGEERKCGSEPAGAGPDPPNGEHAVRSTPTAELVVRGPASRGSRWSRRHRGASVALDSRSSAQRSCVPSGSAPTLWEAARGARAVEATSNVPSTPHPVPVCSEVTLSTWTQGGEARGRRVCPALSRRTSSLLCTQIALCIS
jgi:hypothetical protein